MKGEGKTTQCGACDGLVSRMGLYCPHCGHPLARRRRRGNWGLGCLILVLIFLVLWVVPRMAR